MNGSVKRHGIIHKVICEINEMPDGPKSYALNEPITNWKVLMIEYRTHATGIRYMTFVFPEIDTGAGLDCIATGQNAYGGFPSSTTLQIKGTVGSGYPYITRVIGLVWA